MSKRSKSIAILPFIPLHQKEDLEFLCDGMTEELINALCKIEDLMVSSRSAVFKFKKSNLSAAAIGQQLGVTLILEGNIQRSGQKLRIGVKLINVEEQLYLWSDRFDRQMDDLFALQDEISLLIAEKTRESLGHLEIEDQLIEPKNIPVETYELYLKSRYHLLKMSQDDIEKGMDMLQSILKEYPQFALAYLSLHLSYALLGSLGFMASDKAFSEGFYYLNKAIEIDKSLPECQLHLAYQSFLQKWDFEEAYHHLNEMRKKRLSLEYYQTMTSILVAEGQFKAAMNYIEAALSMDPFSDINHHLKGYIYYVRENYDLAIPLFEKSLALKEGSIVSVLYLGQALLLQGKLEKAKEFFAKYANHPDSVLFLSGQCLINAYEGVAVEYEERLALLEAQLEGKYKDRILPVLVMAYTILGKYDLAMDKLEFGINNRIPLLIYLGIEPILKPLHTLERYQHLISRLVKPYTGTRSFSKKYKKPLLTAEYQEKLKFKLENMMQEKQPFLDPNLSLRHLASLMNLPANQLSQVLNEGFNKNFSAFVNSYRLEAFKSKLKDKSNSHLTLLALAFESGFNSKTVFNTFFKKEMGKTPKAYHQEIRN